MGLKLAHFGKRGLTKESIIACGLEVVTWDGMIREARTGSKLLRVDADRIPYHGLDGQPLRYERSGTNGVRFRRHIVGNSKEPKYLSPQGSGALAYLPPRADVNWGNVAHDPTVEICITEGEYKAIVSNQCDGPLTLALGGVWMFRNKNKTDFCSPLDQFIWKGREVYLAFDADAESTKAEPFKPSVKQALISLVNMLRDRGAIVKIVNFTETEQWSPGKKLGLDDYLLEGGDWGSLGATEANLGIDPDLMAMMEKYALYRGSGPHILSLEDNIRFTRTEFIMSVENDKRMLHPTTGKQVRTAELFYDHPDAPTFKKYVFDPSLSPGLDAERSLYNGWPGMSVEPVEDAEVTEVYEQYMKRMCGQHFDYVVSWWAHTIQRPWEKTTIALLCKGAVNGSGKSLMGAIHGNVFGPQLFHGSMSLEDVVSDNFNTPLANKILVQCDEAGIFYKGVGDKLLNFISNPSIDIEPKGVDKYTLANLIRLFITTNSDMPMRLTEHNRRMFVWEPGVTQADARGEWGDWLRERAVKVLLGPKGASGVLAYLMNVDVSEWDPQKPALMTDEARELIEVSATKTQNLASLLYDRLNAEEHPWVFVSSELAARFRNVFATFTGVVKAGGGQKARDQYTSNKLLTKGSFYELKTRNVELRRDGDSNLWPVAGQLASDTKKMTCLRVEAICVELESGTSHNDKY
jgi:hypothetical protein